RDTAERLAAAPGLDGAERAALPRATTRRSGPRPLEQPVSSRFASLPSSLSSFVGRERERAEVRRLLAETRLLTLVGAGGVGKTRLALVVAEELRAMAGTSVGFVDLAPLADPQLVPHTVAAGLGIRERSRHNPAS